MSPCLPCPSLSYLANTSFMAGAGYILSQDLVKKVIQWTPSPARYASSLPPWSLSRGNLMGPACF